jgi:O-antigen/teichoic acid export membrane protein
MRDIPPADPASAAAREPERIARGRKPFISDVLRLLRNQVMVTVISFVTGVVLARSLGAEGRGIVAAVLVYPLMFIALAELGVRQSSIFYLGKKIFSDAQVVGAVSSLILLTGVFGMVVCTGLLVATGNPAFTPLIIALAVTGVPATLAVRYSSGIFLGKRLVGQFTTVQLMAEVQRLVVVVVLVWWLSWGVAGALIATVLSSLLVAGFALRRVSGIASLAPTLEWEVIRALLVKGAVYALALFVLTLNYRVDIVLMERLSTASEIGIYAIAVGLAQLVGALPQSVTPALFSHTANDPNEREFSGKVARLFRVTVLIGLIGMAGLMVAAPLLIPAVYGRDFYGSVIALQLLLPGVVCLVAFKILYGNLAGRGRPNISLWVTIPALLLNILLNIYLLPRYGARGASVASSISYSLAFIGMMLLYCNVTGIPLRELCRYQWSDFSFVRRFLPGAATRTKANNRSV